MWELRTRRGAAGFALMMLLLLARVPQQGALTNPHMWTGIVPALVYDAQHMGPELLPSAVVTDSLPEDTSGLDERMIVDSGLALADMRKQFGADLPKLSEHGMTFDWIDQGTLSEAQRRLLEEGHRLADSLEQLRVQLSEEVEDVAVASEERLRLLQEFWQRYARLHDIQAQFSEFSSKLENEALQPLVADVLKQVGKSLEPLKNLADTCAQQVTTEMAKFMLGPGVVAAVANLQALAGLAALVDMADVVGRIRSTCSAGSRTNASIKKAAQHLNRAESDVVSAQSALDRIMDDALADRPPLNQDLNLFSIEQHDLAVQLANVRSSLDSAHTAVARDIRMMNSRSVRWC